MVLLRRYEDRTVEALSCSGQAVQKVRLDVGWEGALEGEGVEGVQMEWNALCYDITVSLSSLAACWYCIFAPLLPCHVRLLPLKTATAAAFNLKVLPYLCTCATFASFRYGVAQTIFL